MDDTVRRGRLGDAALAAVYVATALAILATYQESLAELARRWRSWYAEMEYPTGNLWTDVLRGIRNAD
jgi:hypothetical protein